MYKGLTLSEFVLQKTHLWSYGYTIVHRKWSVLIQVGLYTSGSSLLLVSQCSWSQKHLWRVHVSATVGLRRSLHTMRMYDTQ